MQPDWKPIQPGDALYDAGTPKWAADAYGHDDLRVLPDVGPDGHVAPTYWTMSRVPNSNTIGSRFIAVKV